MGAKYITYYMYTESRGSHFLKKETHTVNGLSPNWLTDVTNDAQDI